MSMNLSKDISKVKLVRILAVAIAITDKVHYETYSERVILTYLLHICYLD